MRDNDRGHRGHPRRRFSTHMLADASALTQVPDELDAVESALLLCAGVTTFNALCNCGADPAI